MAANACPGPSPFSAGLDQLLKHRGRRVCVLASGDPMSYGIGATLARRIPPAEMIVVPAPGAFDLACARMGWARAEVETLTLHGRPLALLHAYVQPGARLLILSENGDNARRRRRPAGQPGLRPKPDHGPGTHGRPAGTPPRLERARHRRPQHARGRMRRRSRRSPAPPLARTCRTKLSTTTAS